MVEPRRERRIWGDEVTDERGDLAITYGYTGTEICPSCGKYLIVEVVFPSGFLDEPRQISYVRECFGCNWSEPSGVEEPQ